MDPLPLLAAGRLAIGAVATCAPSLAARSMGLDPASSPQLAHMTRLFGLRELFMGGAALRAGGQQRRELARGAAFVDAGDAVAALLAARAGQLGGRAASVTVVPATVAVVAAVLGTRRPRG